MNAPIPVSSIHEPGLFSTRDIALAGVLMTLRFPLTGVDFQIEGAKNHPIGYFKFDDSPTLQDAKKRYMSSMLSVEPKTLLSNIDSLKAEISNIRSNPHSKFC